jgi:hypothetical protein
MSEKKVFLIMCRIKYNAFFLAIFVQKMRKLNNKALSSVQGGSHEKRKG